MRASVRAGIGLTLPWLLVLHSDATAMTSQAAEDPQPERIRIFDSRTGRVAVVEVVRKSEEEWRQQLSPEAFQVTRRHGTEAPFSGVSHDAKREGLYRCIGCGTDLFSSETKFDSGTGWPSFWQAIATQNIRLVLDTRWFMRRTEVQCARCGAHLGHVFDDGPPPTGKRYCINSVALQFAPRAEPGGP